MCAKEEEKKIALRDWPNRTEVRSPFDTHIANFASTADTVFRFHYSAANSLKKRESGVDVNFHIRFDKASRNFRSPPRSHKDPNKTNQTTNKIHQNRTENVANNCWPKWEFIVCFVEKSHKGKCRPMLWSSVRTEIQRTEVILSSQWDFSHLIAICKINKSNVFARMKICENVEVMCGCVISIQLCIQMSQHFFFANLCHSVKRFDSIGNVNGR